MSPPETEHGSLKEFWARISENRIGLFGFLLSLGQVVVHAMWIAFVVWLSGTGRAEQLSSNDWQMWAITGLILIAAVLTAVSLFMCLYGAIHGRPKVLAIIGLCLSFFVGALTTFGLLFSALQST